MSQIETHLINHQGCKGKQVPENKAFIKKCNIKNGRVIHVAGKDINENK